MTRAEEFPHEEWVSNIVAAYNKADDDQLTRGRNWYVTANEIATQMSEGNTRAGAGVLAALSPQKSWYLNQRIARESFESGEARGNVGNAVAKAQRIMEGEDPLQVLPEDSKSWNFFRNIVDPSDEEAVTIDRHAHDVAVGAIFGQGDRKITKRKYAALSHAYREAARRLDEIPNVVQAVTWCYQVETVVGDLPRRPGRRNINKV